MEPLSSVASIAVGCTLIVLGIQNASSHLLELAELPLFHLFKPSSGKESKSFFKGILVSALTGSTLTSVSTLLGLVNAGLIRVKSALLFMAGAHLGPLVLLFLLNFLALREALFFLSFALLNQLFRRFKKGQIFQKVFGLVLGLGLVALGRHFLGQGLSFYHGVDEALFGSLYEATFVLSLLTGLILGGFLCLLFRSSLIAMLVVILVRDGQGMNMVILLSTVIGIHALNFWPIYRLGVRGNAFATRVSGGQMMIGLIGLLMGVLILLARPEDLYSGGGFSLLLFFVILRVLSVVVFVLALKPIRVFLQKRWPKSEEKSPYELENLGRSQDMVPAMSLVQSSIHLTKFKNILDRLFQLTEEYLVEGEASGRAMAKIKDYERITDNMNREIRQFLGQLSENSLTPNQALAVQSHLRISDALENIADYVDKVASYHTRYLQGGGNAKWREEFVQFYRQIKEFYMQVTETIPLRPEGEEKQIRIQAQKLKIAAESLREEHLKRFEEFADDPSNLMTYSDMIVCMRKMRGHSLKLYQRLIV